MKNLNAMTAVFVILKLSGVIDWDWIWVLAPTWGALILFLLYMAYIFIKSEYNKNERHNNKM